jgi:membrane-bound metal-dependent hydrolase YbcI (DUF457 family)
VFPFGHVGIGPLIVPRRVRATLSSGWLAFGCLLPDLLDKPVFVAARVARRTLPDQFDLLLDALHGSRLFGHSLFFFALLLGATRLTRSAVLRAVTWGVATHLLLDIVPDLIPGTRLQPPTWLLWPVFGWGWPFDTTPANLHYGGYSLEGLIYRFGELVGAALIIVDVARRGRVREQP